MLEKSNRNKINSLKLIRYIDKIFKLIFYKVAFKVSWLTTFVKFKLNGVVFLGDFIARGIPIINVNLKGKMVVGEKFVIHSGKYYNMIGNQGGCYFIVGKDATLIIGNNVGISNSAIVCHCLVEIHDNVRIGGGCLIYDTDFHSLNIQERIANPEVRVNIKTAPIIIERGVFIGASVIILKSVIIGENSIVGAGSVITKSIPKNEIWAGNPARFIKKINDEQ